MRLFGYNIAAELINILIAITVLYLSVATRPRRTAVFSVVYYGLIASVVNIVLHIATVGMSEMTTVVSKFWYKSIVFGYYVSYLVVLMLLVAYMNLLTLKQRERIENLYATVLMFSGCYVIIVGTVFAGGLYIGKNISGHYMLTPLFNINLVLGIAAIVLVALTSFANRNGIPRVMVTYIRLFVPIEIGMLVLQLLMPRVIFLSVTYTIPFFLVYIVFHSILFDEVTGCQDRGALESHYSSLIKKNKKFVICYIKLPRMEYVDNEDIVGAVKRTISKDCRRLERSFHSARAYKVNHFTYAVVYADRGEERFQALIEHINNALQEAMKNWHLTHRPEYKLVVIRDNPALRDMPQLETFANYLFEKADKKKVNFYEAADKDFIASEKRHNVEKVIVDIRNNNNLNDPRVVVFAQPIFDVSNETYHTAEALMRLEVDGEIVPPSVFIPLAEKNGCIHTLTRIILNKVCRKVYELQDYYLFDAISVNVSLSEFMDFCLHDELVDIIESNGIRCSRIRLEMTESMTSDEMEAITHNMEEFNKAGVSFYLDDFGTGYSNLERIVSLPFKTIKFDKSLLYKSLDDPILLQLIENMVDVFKTHEMVVLVEGVENEEQASLSKELGFEYIQGYNYSPPVPIGEIETFFEKKKKGVC